MITKKNQLTEFWFDLGKEFVEEFEKPCKAERIRSYCTLSVTKAAFALNVQYDHWKRYYTITWETTDISTFTNCLKSSQLWALKKVLGRFDTKECKEIRLPGHSVKQAITRISNTQIEDGAEFTSRNKTYPSRRVISHSVHRKFLKLLQIRPEKLQYTQKRMNSMRLSVVNFMKKSWSK